MPQIVMIPIEELHPHPQNPRKELGDLSELADSIKASGVFQNLTVIPGHWMTHEEWAELSAQYKEKPTEELKALLDGKWLETGYTVVIGHRRRSASKIAGLTQLPCVIVEMTPKEQLQTMLLENMQRSDLTVYEQAQGFQLMIEMGDTVDGIVEKTGFSKATVKRRLKMAELDQNTLKEVSSRQLSLADFDKLAQIENMEERNACLRHIGTANFNMETERSLRKQNIAKNMPAVRNALRLAKAKKMEQRDVWYGEYSEIQGAEIEIDKLKDGVVPIPNTTEKLFYFLEESYGRLRFFTKKKKAAPIKRPQEEIDREKACKEANETCMEISELCKRLRSEFVKTLVLNTRNREAMLNGAVSAIMSLSVKYGSPSSTAMYEAAGIERKWDYGENERLFAALQANSERTYPQIIYAAFCDTNEYYHSVYKQQWPVHTSNQRLDLMYAWLVSVGYVMSDEEKALQDGSHEIFKDPAKARKEPTENQEAK